MAHQYKTAAHKNDPKWLGELRRATGGGVSARRRDGSGGPMDYRRFGVDDNTSADSVSKTIRFRPTSDSDNQGPMGAQGPSLGEAQTDEIGTTRRFQAIKRSSTDDAADERLWPEREDRPAGYEVKQALEPHVKRGGRIVKRRADGGSVSTSPTAVPLPKPDPRGYDPIPTYRDGQPVWPDLPRRKKSG